MLGAGRGGGLGSSGLVHCRSSGGLVAVTTTGAVRTVTAVTARATRRARSGGLLGRELLGRHVALVDPHLDADATEGGAGLVEAVVDLRTQRVQRDATLAVELGAAHLGAVEAARDLHADALGAGALGGLHALAHGAAERHTGRELLGDALGDQLGDDLGVLDLEDVQLDLLARELLELATDAVGLGAAAADDDARAGRVDVDADAVTGALDLDRGDARALHARGHEATDGDVFLDVVAVTLTRLGRVGEPAALVVRRDAQTEAMGVDLLTHQRAPFVFFGEAATTVMWLVRLLMRPARPWARGRNRFIVGPSSTNAAVMTRLRSSKATESRSALTRALAMALSSTFCTGSEAACGANCSVVTASVATLPRIMSTTRRAF